MGSQDRAGGVSGDWEAGSQQMAENNIGITIEGLQEFHDEACLAVLNNKYGDGIKWHDVACHFRSVIVCEDSDQLINLIATQEGVDVRDEADEGTNAIDVDSLP